MFCTHYIFICFPNLQCNTALFPWAFILLLQKCSFPMYHPYDYVCACVLKQPTVLFDMCILNPDSYAATYFTQFYYFWTHHLIYIYWSFWILCFWQMYYTPIYVDTSCYVSFIWFVCVSFAISCNVAMNIFVHILFSKSHIGQSLFL